MIFAGIIVNTWRLSVLRTTEQAQGGKAVGVDPSLITACEYFSLHYGEYQS